MSDPVLQLLGWGYPGQLGQQAPASPDLDLSQSRTFLVEDVPDHDLGPVAVADPTNCPITMSRLLSHEFSLDLQAHEALICQGKLGA